VVRILRVKQLGTGYGGPGNPKAAPGIQHGIRDDTIGDAQAPAVLQAYASEREAARATIQATTIKSKGNL